MTKNHKKLREKSAAQIAVGQFSSQLHTIGK